MRNGLRAAAGATVAALVAGLGISPAIAASSATTEPTETPAVAPAPPEIGGYIVNPGDVLDISVWKEEDLKKQVLVRPDGYFSFPLAGDIRANGRTVEDVRRELANRISRFIPDPVVSVAIMEARGSEIYVIGQVQRPGEFPANRFVDVIQALSMAGGTTPFAQLDSIKILRREGSTQQAIPFSYSDIAAGRRLQQNIVLKPGDTVLVP